jgi:hypothetical protein
VTLKFYDIFCVSVTKLCRLLGKRHKHSRNYFFLKKKKTNWLSYEISSFFIICFHLIKLLQNNLIDKIIWTKYYISLDCQQCSHDIYIAPLFRNKQTTKSNVPLFRNKQIPKSNVLIVSLLQFLNYKKLKKKKIKTSYCFV